MKTNLDSLLSQVRDCGLEPTLTELSYQNIIETGLRSKNLPLAFAAAQIALEEHPLTLRGLMYRLVSLGFLSSTDRPNYTRLGRIMATLREERLVPFSWIVDNVRATIKPSSWSGLGEFVSTVLVWRVPVGSGWFVSSRIETGRGDSARYTWAISRN